MTHVEGPCGVRTDKLNLHGLPRACIGAPVGFARIQNGSHYVGLLALTDEKVDKPGTRNITAVDQAVIRQRGDQLSGEIARCHAGTLCQHHGNVARQVAVACVPRAIDLWRCVR